MRTKGRKHHVWPLSLQDAVQDINVLKKYLNTNNRIIGFYCNDDTALVDPG